MENYKSIRDIVSDKQERQELEQQIQKRIEELKEMAYSENDYIRHRAKGGQNVLASMVEIPLDKDDLLGVDFIGKDRKEILSKRFRETWDREPSEVFGEHFDERELEIGIRMKDNPMISLALLIQSIQELEDIDKDHLSKESKEEMKTTRKMIDFNKKIECVRYGMDWSKIQDLFMSNQYQELEDARREDFDLEEMENYDL